MVWKKSGSVWQLECGFNEYVSCLFRVSIVTYKARSYFCIVAVYILWVVYSVNQTVKMLRKLKLHFLREWITVVIDGSNNYILDFYSELCYRQIVCKVMTS